MEIQVCSSKCEQNPKEVLSQDPRNGKKSRKGHGLRGDSHSQDITSLDVTLAFAYRIERRGEFGRRMGNHSSNRSVPEAQNSVLCLSAQNITGRGSG